jgi:hypothetical protein
MTDLIEKIESSDLTDQDILWSILKRKDLSIKKKLECMARVVGVDPEETLAGAEKNSTGWILDYENRMIIHEALLRAGQD